MVPPTTSGSPDAVAEKVQAEIAADGGTMQVAPVDQDGDDIDIVASGMSGDQRPRERPLTPAEQQKLREEWAIIEPRLQTYLEANKSVGPEDGSWSGWWRRFLCALGGGTGATVGGTGLWFLDKDLANRMQLQDEAVLCLLLFVYFLTLAFSGILAYRQAKNRSPVTFYADPRFFNITAEGHDTESFLDAFNQAPKGTYLHVTGYSPTYQDAPGSLRWRGTSYLVDFAFSLDLSMWVRSDGGSPAASAAPGTRGAQSPPLSQLSPDGVVLADVADLRDFLAQDGQRSPLSNDMAVVEMQKFIAWPQWEELATNIKWHMRQLGYTGVVHVECTECETMCIYKNTQWANFMHSKTLKVIIALSVIGWLVYAPYMFLRCSRQVVRSYHRVDIGIADYWPLIADHLHQYGFDPLMTGPGRRPMAAGFSVATEDLSWSDTDDQLDPTMLRGAT